MATLKNQGIRYLAITGFVVSGGQKKCDFINGLPVYEIGDIGPNDDTAVLIAVSYEHREAVEKVLDSHGFVNYIYGY